MAILKFFIAHCLFSSYHAGLEGMELCSKLDPIDCTNNHICLLLLQIPVDLQLWKKISQYLTILPKTAAYQ